MRKKLNINEFIWFIILIAITGYFYHLVYSAKLAYFIHPKMFKYIYFTLIILSLMTVYQTSNLFKEAANNKLKSGYLLFMFILFIGFAVDPKGLNAQAAINRGMKIENSIFNVSKNNKVNPDKNVPIKRRPGGAIEVNDENYVSVMNDIYNNIKEYKGQTITVTGFIYKEDRFGKDRFVAARMLVSCCAADAQVVGYLFKYNGKEEFAKEQWVKVTGIINEDKIVGEDKEGIPIIDVSLIQKINEPLNKYVYE